MQARQWVLGNSDSDQAIIIITAVHCCTQAFLIACHLVRLTRRSNIIILYVYSSNFLRKVLLKNKPEPKSSFYTINMGREKQKRGFFLLIALLIGGKMERYRKIVDDRTGLISITLIWEVNNIIYSVCQASLSYVRKQKLARKCCENLSIARLRPSCLIAIVKAAASAWLQRALQFHKVIVIFSFSTRLFLRLFSHKSFFQLVIIC